LSVVPVANEQIGAQPHPFPANEHEQVVVGQDQDEHGGHEQVEVGEKAVIARVTVHVADRVDMHEEADPTDDKEHDGAERINLQAHVRRKRTGKDPGVEFCLDGLTRVHDEAENHDQRTY
jgi:hypothetical protein